MLTLKQLILMVPDTDGNRQKYLRLLPSWAGLSQKDKDELYHIYSEKLWFEYLRRFERRKQTASTEDDDEAIQNSTLIDLMMRLSDAGELPKGEISRVSDDLKQFILEQIQKRPQKQTPGLTFKQLVIITPLEEAVKRRLLEKDERQELSETSKEDFTRRCWKMLEIDARVKLADLQELPRYREHPNEAYMKVLSDYIVEITLEDPQGQQDGIFSELNRRLFPQQSIDPAVELKKLVTETNQSAPQQQKTSSQPSLALLEATIEEAMRTRQKGQQQVQEPYKKCKKCGAGVTRDEYISYGVCKNCGSSELELTIEAVVAAAQGTIEPVAFPQNPPSQQKQKKKHWWQR
jgi:hypothetical protein